MSSLPPSLQRRPEAERQQIHAALVEVCQEGGLGAATLEQVIERAGVQRQAFYRHFSNLDDCFAQYLHDSCAPFIGSAWATTEEGAGKWRAQLRAIFHAMVRFWREDEPRAHMLLVETLAAGPLSSRICDQVFETMVDLIDRGRLLMDDPPTLTRMTAEATAGAFFYQMHQLQARGELDQADELVPQLMYFVVLPYLGMEAAVEELFLPPLPEP